MQTEFAEYGYDLLGSLVRVWGPEQDLQADPGVLAPFRTECRVFDRELYCALRDRLPPPEGNLRYCGPDRREYEHGPERIVYLGPVQDSWQEAWCRIRRQGTVSRAELTRRHHTTGIHGRLIFTVLEPEKTAIENGGFLLHAACIAVKGQAIVFTAPSGTGKSTQAALWQQLRGAQIINGDRIMVRNTPEGVQILGVPFSGSSGISVAAQLPLKAVVYLSQAPVTAIRPLSGAAAFRRIWEGCSVYTWDRRDVESCSGNVARVLDRVPVWHLACRPDASAVTVLEEKLGMG